jgi:hypothetical protein
MKIPIFRLLSLMVFLSSFGHGQSVTRCGGPNTALYINWPMFQFDVCHTGYNPYETRSTPAMWEHFAFTGSTASAQR